MPNSQRFIVLKKRLSELRRTMLPIKFSPIGNYSDKALDRARGYRLLAHAEIETYLEDVCKKLVLDAIAHWKSKKKATSLLLATLASYHSGWNVEDDINHQEIIQLARARFKTPDIVTDIIETAAKQYAAQISANHGVKTKNLMNLLLPTGIIITELDQTWILNMEAFGALRGESAHSSKHTTTQINPQDELNTIIQLLVGLKELDLKMELLRKEIK